MQENGGCVVYQVYPQRVLWTATNAVSDFADAVS